MVADYYLYLCSRPYQRIVRNLPSAFVREDGSGFLR